MFPVKFHEQTGCSQSLVQEDKNKCWENVMFFSSKKTLNKQASIERHYMAEFTPF